MTTATFGDRAGTTYAGTEDAMLYSAGPTTNYSAEVTAAYPVVERYPGLTSIAAGVTVSDAFFTINITSGDSPSGTITVKRVLRAWVETQATWNIYSTGNNWGTAGCLSDGADRVAADSCGIVYPGGFVTGDINSTTNTTLIADVQAIINGTYANNGWLISPSAAITAMGMPANATAANRPLLTVTYTAAAVTPPSILPRTIWINP